MKRVLNPRITFTASKYNLPLYQFIQSQLEGKGRFINKEENTIRYIIGDIEGLKLLIKLMHNKLRTPKNITFNKLILFMNSKYNLHFKESNLDTSDINSNSWFTGFIDPDGYFGLKISESKVKSDSMKRSRSFSINLRFNIYQRSIDRVTSLSMYPIMEKISKFLDCNLQVVKKKSKSCFKVGSYRSFDC